MADKIKKALVVDDEESLREIITEVLGLLNIESIVAENGHQAIELAEQHKQEIDLFLIDLFMPNMSGQETYTRINELIPGKAVIFMSGFDRSNTTLAGEMPSNQHFLKKPFGIMELKDLIASII